MFFPMMPMLGMQVSQRCRKASKPNKKKIPDTGTVRLLRLTEKQFCNMGLYQTEGHEGQALNKLIAHEVWYEK